MALINCVILLLSDEANGSKLPEVNDYFNQKLGDRLILLEDLGVNKVARYEFEEMVALGAIAFLNKAEFVAHLRAIDWPEPEFVKCLISSGQFEGFEVFPMEGKNKSF